MTFPSFPVTTIDIDSGTHVPATCYFTRIPVVGELLTIKADNQLPNLPFDVYEVVAVAHATEGGGSADIFARRLGPGPARKHIR